MKSFKFYIILLAAVFISNSCTDHFEALNTNPHALTFNEVDETLIGQAFAKAQYGSLYGLGLSYQIAQNLHSDLYCQYFATTKPAFTSDRYGQPFWDWISLAWDIFYTQAAPNMQLVEEAAFQAGFSSHYAITRIWKVYAYQRMTDYRGPVIFSEFGNGDTSVPYDNQESMYRSFFTMLDESMATLKENTGGNAIIKRAPAEIARKAKTPQPV